MVPPFWHEAHTVAPLLLVKEFAGHCVQTVPELEVTLPAPQEQLTNTRPVESKTGVKPELQVQEMWPELTVAPMGQAEQLEAADELENVLPEQAVQEVEDGVVLAVPAAHSRHTGAWLVLV